MACIYTLNNNKFNNEEELDNYIRANNLHKNIGDFKFSRKEDLAKRNVEALTEMREKNSLRLKELGDSNKMKELLEDEEDTNMTFTDNHISVLDFVIDSLNRARIKYLETKNKDYWWQMIQLLPSSYNQRRTVQLNYQVLKSMYFARKDHKLDEWQTLCHWIERLPYSQLIIGGNTDG